jgi:hypothetical protein
MKRFHKTLLLAMAFLLVIPGITFASALTYPITGSVDFDNPAGSPVAVGATLDFSITAISSSVLLYCYTLKNINWDPTDDGIFNPLGIKKIEVPAAEAAAIVGAGNAYWDGGSTASITSFQASPFATQDDTILFDYFVQAGNTLDPGLVPSASVTFYVEATNHAGTATFKIWDGGNSQTAPGTAAVMGPVGNDLTVVPEPGTLLLVGSGLLGLAGLRRRKRSV